MFHVSTDSAATSKHQGQTTFDLAFAQGGAEYSLDGRFCSSGSCSVAESTTIEELHRTVAEAAVDGCILLPLGFTIELGSKVEGKEDKEKEEEDSSSSDGAAIAAAAAAAAAASAGGGGGRYGGAGDTRTLGTLGLCKTSRIIIVAPTTPP